MTEKKNTCKSYIESLYWIYNKYICGNVINFVYYIPINVEIEDIITYLQETLKQEETLKKETLKEVKEKLIYYRLFSSKIYFILCAPLVNKELIGDLCKKYNKSILTKY
jgi:hypothetical protein